MVLTRREALIRAGAAGVGLIVARALPIAEAMAQALPSELDGPTLQAFADTILPGRKVDRTDLGDPIDARAIAGVDPLPGAVQADVLRLFQDDLLGFPTLAPAFLADLTARGGTFLLLDYDGRSKVVEEGMSFDNPDRLLWEAAAAFPFLAFCAAGAVPNATYGTSSGYRVMGLPGTAPNGYHGASYRRKLSTERTRRGYLP
jgi:hypothetical protein